MIQGAFFSIFNWFANNPFAQFLAALAAIFAGIKLIKRQGTLEERNRRAVQDAKDKIKIYEMLDEMKAEEQANADKAQDAGRNPGPSASNELSDAAFDLTFGRLNREGQD